MDRYIDSHTSTEKMKVMRNKMSRDMDEVKNTYGTAAHKSAAIAFVWRHTLRLGSVREIQEVCREPMARLGDPCPHWTLAAGDVRAVVSREETLGL